MTTEPRTPNPPIAQAPPTQTGGTPARAARRGQSDAGVGTGLSDDAEGRPWWVKPGAERVPVRPGEARESLMSCGQAWRPPRTSTRPLPLWPAHMIRPAGVTVDGS